MTQQQTQRTCPVPVSTRARSATAQPVRSTYDQLIARGLDPDEAANLTAFINGMPLGVQPWTITGISHLLFVRELNRAGRFGPTDGHDR